MDIKILGTRGEIKPSAPYHSKKSGVLIDGKLLLDCGDKRFLAYHPRYILITHLHPDHAFFVREGRFAIPDAAVYAPEPFQNAPIICTASPFTIGSYHITPIPTIHSIKVQSNAYLIEHKRKKILYTGDMIWIEKQYHHLLHDLDLVITEASHIRDGGVVRRDPKTGHIFGHTGIPNLIALFHSYTPSIVLTHFGSWFYQDMKKGRAQCLALGREYDVEVIVGYDGLELEI
jgi:ribonuclease BN (tRNA processing enzyme)